MEIFELCNFLVFVYVKFNILFIYQILNQKIYISFEKMKYFWDIYWLNKL
jgi:hypothetical protein